MVYEEMFRKCVFKMKNVLIGLAIVALILFIVIMTFVLAWGIWYAEIMGKYLSSMVSVL